MASKKTILFSLLLLIITVNLMSCSSSAIQIDHGTISEGITNTPALQIESEVTEEALIGSPSDWKVIPLPTIQSISDRSKSAINPPVETLISRPPLDGGDWQDFPIVPAVSDYARQVYQDGLQRGNDSRKFSKIGDCQNINTYFLAIYDHPDQFVLGEEYHYLQNTIDYYSGSWSRESISVRGGFNVASVFNPWFNDKDLCGENESPVDCELRVHQPSVVLISMETWWNSDTSKYEGYLRKIVDTVISYGAVPVLTTKADNLEGDHSINQAIARVAYEYDLPLWNYWAAVQPLPSKGLTEDGFHITHGLNDFSDPENLKGAWPIRNLTALQVLDSVRQGLEGK